MSEAIRDRRSRICWTCLPMRRKSWASWASGSKLRPTRLRLRPCWRRSVNYPLRGAVAWKSIVGTNVASDALSNVASGGVRGGAMIIVGEDYGEGSSIMQERTHAFAMKSQIWLLDPRPSLPSIVAMVEKGFELSEASNTPVMLELGCAHATFMAGSRRKTMCAPRSPSRMRWKSRSAIPIASCCPPPISCTSARRSRRAWPAAVEFIRRHRMNEFLGGLHGRCRHHRSGRHVQQSDARARTRRPG